jgi:hypothetical protein
MTEIFTKWKGLFASKKMGNLSLGYEKPGKKLSASDVDALLTLFDEAYKAIDKYKESDPALYAKLKANIDMEWLSPAKLAIKDFSSQFGSLSFLYKVTHKASDIKPVFKQIVADLGITNASEFDKIETITG